MDATYDYTGVGTSSYIPYSKHNFNTTACGYDFLNKSGTFLLTAGLTERQCVLQIFD